VRRPLLLVCLAVALTTTSQGALELAYPLRQHELGDPLNLVGLAFGLLSVGSLLSRLPAGAWYRSAMAGRQIAVSLIVFGLTAGALGFTDVWLLQAALAVVHGFAFGLVTTFLLALLVDAQPRTANAAPSIAWFTAAITTGYGLGSLLGAQAIEIASVQAGFVFSAITGLLGILLALYMPSPRAHERTEGHASVAGLRAIAGLPATVWLACLVGFYLNFAQDAYDSFFPIYAVGVGIAVATIGVFRSLSAIASASIRFAAAGALRAWRPTTLTHAGILLIAAAGVTLSVTTSEWLLGGAFVLFALMRALLRVTSATAVADERQRSGGSVGMASAVYNAGLDAGAILGPPAAGVLAGVFDIPTSFRVVALGLPVVYYVIWTFVNQPRRRAAPLGTGLALHD
jgi:MFS family permease